MVEPSALAANVDQVSVPLSAVVALIATLVSVAAGIYTVLARLAFDTYMKATEKRFGDLEIITKKQEQEGHTLEKKTITIEGEIKSLLQNHNHSTDDIEEIKSEMVTRKEWETRMTHMQTMLESILRHLQVPGYKHVSSGGHTAVRFPEGSGGGGNR